MKRAADVDPLWDPLVSPSDDHTHWTTVNVGEAIAGVQTPLSWTFFAEGAESSSRRACHAVGALTRTESALPERIEDRDVRVFYGRAAIRCQVLATLGDRFPGTTGEETVRSVIGHVPGDLVFAPTRRRYPVLAWRLPWTFITLPRRLPRFVAEYDAWRRVQLARIPHLDLPELAALVREARTRLTEGVVFQTTVLFGVVQPLYDALARTVEEAGTGDLSVLSGTGGAEMAVIGDVWEASRGRRTVTEVIADHGFHGPAEGELSSRVWREDDTPLRRTIEQYAGRPETDAPGLAAARHQQAWAAERDAVLAGLPPHKRAGARLLLHLAHERITLRGYAKRSFLGAIDVGRAAARRSGELHAAAGVLEAPDDVFQLTLDELTLGMPANAHEVVAARSDRYAGYLTQTIPREWRGMPEPIPLARGQDLAVGDVVDGLGVSQGVVEGVARVVLTPDFEDVEDGEILVAPITDPSWSSIMFVSAALVVDIGGPLSHAAVVARELQIPCVVNTSDGSARLQTGDRIRVDGKAGTVELLARA